MDFLRRNAKKCMQMLRLSRGRRVIENVFGIMAVKWRILLKPIETSDATADVIVKAICALHNFVIDECNRRHLRTVARLRTTTARGAATSAASKARHCDPEVATAVRKQLATFVGTSCDFSTERVPSSGRTNTHSAVHNLT